MTVTDILTIGCGEYKELVFVLFPHLTRAPARTYFLSTYGRSYSYKYRMTGKFLQYDLATLASEVLPILVAIHISRHTTFIQLAKCHTHRHLMTQDIFPISKTPYTSYDTTHSQDIFPIRNTHAHWPLLKKITS